MKRSTADILVGALIFALPVLTFGVVGYALVVVAAPRAPLAARIYGGPTQGVTVLAWRMEVLHSVRGFTEPATGGEVAVVAHLGGGRDARWSGRLDAEGMAQVKIALPAAVPGPLDVEITAPGVRTPLARGRVELSVHDWLVREKHLSGAPPAKRSGAFDIAVAPGKGAFAVPFADPLFIDVRDAGQGVAGASLAFEPEGVTIDPPKDVKTGPDGRVVVKLAPRDFHVALKVVATAADGRHGEWYGAVPVVPGAMRARADQHTLRIESPIVRERAYYAVITRTARLAGGPVDLGPDGRGGAFAVVGLPVLPPGPAWAEISSDADLLSPGTVGWPIHAPAGAPARTFTVPDHLLLDGTTDAMARDAARRRRAQLLAGLFSVGALGLLGVLLFLRVRSARVRLEAGLREAGRSEEESVQIAPRSAGVAIAVAIACIAIGFAVVALIAIFRMS